jgi:hypothetical protein
VNGLLERSRIPISLVPERLIVEAARDEGIRLDDLKAERAGRDAVFEEVELARRVVRAATARWWQLVPIWKRLNFTMQLQQQDQWCWAATSVSVAAYYHPTTGWKQCSMVDAEMAQTTCCVDGSSAACNQPNVLDSPLSRAGVLDHMEGGTVAYSAIRGEIDAGHPLAWRIGWSGGGGHFAVIEGYQSLGGEWVSIGDPWYGPSDVAVSSMTGGSYQGSGSWTHTYFTRPPLIRPLPPHKIFIPWELWERLLERTLVLEGERP